MRLPIAPAGYSQTDQAQVRGQLELESSLVHRKNADVEVGSGRLILQSPDGTRYSVGVDNSGNLTTTAI